MMKTPKAATSWKPLKTKNVAPHNFIKGLFLETCFIPAHKSFMLDASVLKLIFLRPFIWEESIPLQKIAGRIPKMIHMAPTISAIVRTPSVWC